MAGLQEQYKDQADKKRKLALRYMVGDKVSLLLRNVKFDGQPSKKLGQQQTKHTEIRVISPDVVELNVQGNIHKRFHVDMILPANENLLPLQVIYDKDPWLIIGAEG